MAAIRSTAGRCDFFGVLDQDILLRSKLAKSIAVFAWVSMHDSNLRQVLAISLSDIKNAGSAEACDAGRLLFVVVGILRLASHNGGENQDAFLTFLDEAAELVPSAKARDLTGIRFLHRDEQDVVQAVAVEPPNRLKIGGKHLAVTLLQRSDEQLGGFVRDFLDLF